MKGYFCLLFRGSNFLLDQVSELCSGSTRDFLNQTILNSLIFPLPPLKEQEEIIQRINDLFSFAKSMEDQFSDLSSSLQLLDRSILAKAFRGELVEQNPNDEPASVLLDCIRAEREQQAQGKAKKSGKKGQRTIKAE